MTRINLGSIPLRCCAGRGAVLPVKAEFLCKDCTKPARARRRSMRLACRSATSRAEARTQTERRPDAGRQAGDANAQGASRAKARASMGRRPRSWRCGDGTAAACLEFAILGQKRTRWPIAARSGGPTAGVRRTLRSAARYLHLIISGEN